MNKFRGRDDRGAVAVEFALVLPVLLIFAVGIIQVGRALNLQITLTAAAREGARVMALRGDASCNAASGSTPAGAKVVTVDSAPGAGLTCSTDVNVTPSTCSAGTAVTVTASKPFTFSIPGAYSGTVTITGKGVMQCGG